MSSHSEHDDTCGCGPSRRAMLGGVALAAGSTAALSAPTQFSPQDAPLAKVGQQKRGPWIDAHVHLQAPDWFSANVFQGPPAQKRRRAGPVPPRGGLYRGGEALEAASAHAGTRRQYGPTLEDQTEKLLAEMDSAGIDTAILYAMDYDYTGQKLKVPHYEQLMRLAEVRDRHPGRFILFAAVDPRRGKSGVEMLRRAHRELKITGMGEFAPHFFDFAPNDRERCYPIYEACAELGLHIAPNCSIISSSISRWCDPLYFEDVAHDFPQVNLCLTSAGFPHWTESAIALAQSKPNVYLDIGDWEARATADPVDTVLRFVRRALDTDARHKILFGSDYPVYNRTVSEKTWVDVFTVDAAQRGIIFSDDDLHLLFSDNAQEYLNLDLAKPMART
jgi:predicted TIM-barrel fold metal-dependent hydrolase